MSTYIGKMPCKATKIRVLRQFIGYAIAAHILPNAPLMAAEKWTVELNAPTVQRAASVKTIENSEASEGKAVELDPGDNTKPLLTVPFPKDAALGRYSIVLCLKADQFDDLGKGLRIEIREGTVLARYAVVHGVHLKGKRSFQDYVLDYDLYDASKPPSLTIFWSDSPRKGYEGKPHLCLDRLEFLRKTDLPVGTVENVVPDRIRYLANETGEVTILVKNNSARPEKFEVRTLLSHDFAQPHVINTQNIDITAGHTTEIKCPIRLGGSLYGYTVAVELYRDGRLIHAREEYFTVHNNHYVVATGLGNGVRDEEPPGNTTNGTWGHAFVGIGHTDAQLQEAAGAPRREKDYTTCMELGRMPGESFRVAPDGPVWIDSQAVTLMSRHEMQVAVQALKKYGVGCHLYLWDPSGLPAIQLMKQHPDWFAYSNDDGDLSGNYNPANAIKQVEVLRKFHEPHPESPTWKGSQQEWNAYLEHTRALAKETQSCGMVGGFRANYALTEVVDYLADQILMSVKMFGWDGIRWDCVPGATGIYWGAYKPFFNFFGKPLAQTPDEMVKQTVANIQRLKARIWKQYPNFAFGYNFGSWEEVNRYPALTAELCKDGGWMLNEFGNWYDSPTSPYHYWEKYYAIQSDTAELISRLGGHYAPMSGYWAYPADRLYGTIFMLATRGHPHVQFHNSQMPAGNYPQFCVRFGRFLFDKALKRLDKPEELINVNSRSPLMWNKSVYHLKDGDKRYLIVHLINPPVMPEIGANAINTLPEPMNNVAVSVSAGQLKGNIKAYGLSAEPWTLKEGAKTQAVALNPSVEKGRVTVVLPQLLYWKILVFESD